MYLRISWGRVRPGRWEEYEAAFKEAVEAAGAVPGLRARVLYRDVDDPDTGYSLSYWDSADAMEAYETSAAVHDEILPRIQPFFGGAFTTNRVRAVFDQQFD